MAKVTNKERNSAISHLLVRVDQMEKIVRGNMELLEHYVVFKDGSTEEFQKWLNKHLEEAHKEDEQQGIQDSNGQDAQGSPEDERQRSKGVRQEDRGRSRELQKSS